MAPHTDLLDERESLKNPFIASVLFHAAVFALFFTWTLRSQANKLIIGSTTGNGTSVAINPVPAVPLPARRGPINPVANDTESLVPQHEAQKAQPRKRQPDPVKDAIPLKSRMPEKPVQHDYLLQKYRAQPVHPNQLTSNQAPAANSMMFSKPGTQQGVGINPNSVLGTKFGGYAQALMEAVARHWNTGGLAGVQTPIVIVNVDIMRNGNIRNPRVVQPSGNSTLDYSALRAVNDAAPLPPLPLEYSGSYLNVDFQFQLHP